MENEIDPKKFFNPEEYITKIIKIDNEEEKAAEPMADADKVSSLISLLTDPANKAIKEEALITLKKEKGGDILLVAIAKAKANRHILVAACWESEINFSKYLPFFVTLALDNDYLVSLEAITTIENMEGPFNENDVTNAIKRLREEQKNITTEKKVLLNDLVVTLEGFIGK